MPHGCSEEFNAYCVIILGCLNHGNVVYLVGTRVGWTGSVDVMASFVHLDSSLLY